MTIRSMLLTTFLLLPACDDAAGPDPVTDDDRGAHGKADGALHGSCEASCGGKATGGSCYCDDKCTQYGDCCSDFVDQCVAPEPDPPACAGTLYVLSNDGEVQHLYRGSVLSHELEEVAVVPYGGSVMWELAAMSPGLAYAVDREGDILVGLDLAVGEVASTVQLDADMHKNGRGLFVLDGELFGLFEGEELRRIDPDTGATERVSTLGGIGGGVESMAVCGDEVLAAASPSGSPRGSNLYRVDVQSGAADLVGPIGETPIDIDTLTCSGIGQLYGVDTAPEVGTDLYQVDAATGTRIFLGSLPAAGGINGLQFM